MEKEGERKYFITIAPGLLEEKHHKKMGSAIWEFLWLLDKVTFIDKEGNGIILGGKPIKLKEVPIGHPINRSKNLHKLQKEGYISIKRAPFGLIIKVNKCQKRFSVFAKSDKAISLNGVSDFAKSIIDSKVIDNNNYTSYKKKNMNDLTYEKNEDDMPTKEFLKKQAISDGYKGHLVNGLINWAEEKMGRRYPAPIKQKKSINAMLYSGFTVEEIKNKFEELEEDDYFKGVDFTTVLSQIAKIKKVKKTNSLLYAN